MPILKLTIKNSWPRTGKAGYSMSDIAIDVYETIKIMLQTMRPSELLELQARAKSDPPDYLYIVNQVIKAEGTAEGSTPAALEAENNNN